MKDKRTVSDAPAGGTNTHPLLVARMSSDEWLDVYGETEDPNERYRLLRTELSRLRGDADFETDVFDSDEVGETLAVQGDDLDGDLLAFVANDFGLPVAFRPEGTSREALRDVRRAILTGKYERHDDLNEVREAILDAHPRVHKVVVAEHGPRQLRYHLPEGSTEDTAFLTVREMVGLVDYTTNSVQREGLSETY